MYFIAAAIFGVAAWAWHRLLTEHAQRGHITHEEVRSFTRAVAAWVILPCLAFGVVALIRGASAPRHLRDLSFHDLPGSAMALIPLALWGGFLVWIWFGRGGRLLSRVSTAFAERPLGIFGSPGAIRGLGTAFVALNLLAKFGNPPPVATTRPLPSPFASMPAIQVLFLALAAVVWLGGGNLLVARHYVRRGKSPWSGFKPFAFPFANFNGLEWLALFGLAVLSLSLGALAISLGN